MSFDPQEFQDYYVLFELENHAPDWPLYKSPETVTILRNKAASFGGLISISHFSRAFNELRASGEIKQLRQPKPADVDDPELTPEIYQSLPMSVVQRRFKSDPEFRSQVENLIAQGKI
jgi:hypothetical protein